MARSTGKTNKTKKPRTGQRKTQKQPDAKDVAFRILSIGAGMGAVAVAAFGLVKLGKRGGGDAGHVPTDLMGDAHPGPEDRAIDAFRPDPTAPIPDSERDAFRPALIEEQARENARLDVAPS